ncbi:MAG: DUF362 domain-containing protein [Deltaproteobacteria bacterium]|nr:DUF362 domain-containing protein [Deltaproteobacteria bacterium]
MEKVGLAKGKRSYDAVRRSLELISDDIHIPSNLPVLIKTNMVMPKVKLSATPVQTIQAIMDHLMEMGIKKFIVAEGTTQGGDTMAAFERFGYFALKEKYDVELRDLNKDEHVKFEVLAANQEPVTVRLARSFLNCYLVSAVPMKAHARVGVTLSIKNLAIGFILDPDRNPKDIGLVSHHVKDLHLSITRLAQVIVPHLSIADGVVGMEGSGPKDGTPIASEVALAGTNALAVDIAGAQIMGFDPRTIGYLWYLSKLQNLSSEDIQVLGEDISQCITRYRAPDNFPRILGWWVENWRAYVEGNYLDSNL